MRITGGTWCGRNLVGPGKGRGIRPTGSRVRQGMFNVLGPVIVGARVLDLFAGLGTLGLEALSRGAKQVTFIDHSRRNLALVRANISRLQCEEQARVMSGDVFGLLDYLGRKQEVFDLILCDPPYRWSGLERLAEKVLDRGILAPRGLMVLEHSAGHLYTLSGWQQVRRKSYGNTCLVFLQADPRGGNL